MSAPTSLARTTVLRIIAGQSDAETIIDEAIRGAVDQSRAVCESILRRIESAHKGSIGSIENTYLPQIGVEEVTRWREQLQADRGQEPPQTVKATSRRKDDATPVGPEPWNATADMDTIHAVDEGLRRRRIQMVTFLEALAATAMVYPDGLAAAPSDALRVTFSTDAFAVLHPVLDAVAALRDIIYASDGCRGHRECLHSMEPWQRARQLLQILSTNGVIDY